ncbi:MAG TPA: CPBP family intramembrane glutamic endopeptidase [Rhizomicrobium sp.]|jgi:membrane protease YdiL (CAAX protease family)|nr:CPBP family intramembrane glutamic endopeptidase [Rhizomicrobium sp.]
MKANTLYVVLAFAFSSVFYALMIASGHVGGGKGWYATGLEWCPAAAVLLTCTLLRIDIGTIGWRWRPWRWQILAYATPLLICLIGYAAVWAAGLGGFPNGKTVDSLKAALGIPSLSTSQVILLWTFLSLIAGTVRSLAGALGEQIGWSGFLSPRLAERYGFTRAAFLTGAVWATWHFPILFFSDFFDSPSPVWFWLPCFVIELLGLSVIILWLRLRSGSVWTGVLVDASLNLWNQDFFAPLTAPRGAITNYTIDESGFMLPFVISITAYLFWRQRAAVLPTERVRA